MSLYRKFKDRFGTAGVVLGVIALILALGGTALAASKLNGTQKKEVSKIAKKEAQKYANSNPGAPGAAGTNGTNGKDGTNGTPGTDGTDGTDGESVEVNAYTGTECEGEGEEGAEFHNNTGTAYACNGKEGSPWTAGGTLPSNSTETGSWYTITSAAGIARTPISFPIPLAAELAFPSNTKFVRYPGVAASGTGDLENGSKLVKNVTAALGETKIVNSAITGEGIPAATTIKKRISSTELELSAEVTGLSTSPKTGVALTTTPVSPPAECESAHAGTASAANPEADPGFLCVYGGTENEGGANLVVVKPGNFTSNSGASVSGAILVMSGGGNAKEYWGTFAVTGAP